LGVDSGTEAGFNAGEMKNFDLNLEAKKYFPESGD
jgi:hypothetical protein